MTIVNLHLILTLLAKWLPIVIFNLGNFNLTVYSFVPNNNLYFKYLYNDSKLMTVDYILILI